GEEVETVEQASFTLKDGTVINVLELEQELQQKLQQVDDMKARAALLEGMEQRQQWIATMEYYQSEIAVYAAKKMVFQIAEKAGLLQQPLFELVGNKGGHLLKYQGLNIFTEQSHYGSAVTMLHCERPLAAQDHLEALMLALNQGPVTLNGIGVQQVRLHEIRLENGNVINFDEIQLDFQARVRHMEEMRRETVALQGEAREQQWSQALDFYQNQVHEFMQKYAFKYVEESIDPETGERTKKEKEIKVLGVNAPQFPLSTFLAIIPKYFNTNNFVLDPLAVAANRNISIKAIYHEFLQFAFQNRHDEAAVLQKRRQAEQSASRILASIPQAEWQARNQILERLLTSVFPFPVEKKKDEDGNYYIKINMMAQDVAAFEARLALSDILAEDVDLRNLDAVLKEAAEFDNHSARAQAKSGKIRKEDGSLLEIKTSAALAAAAIQPVQVLQVPEEFFTQVKESPDYQRFVRIANKVLQEEGLPELLEPKELVQTQGANLMEWANKMKAYGLIGVHTVRLLREAGDMIIQNGEVYQDENAPPRVREQYARLVEFMHVLRQRVFAGDYAALYRWGQWCENEGEYLTLDRMERLLSRALGKQRLPRLILGQFIRRLWQWTGRWFGYLPFVTNNRQIGAVQDLIREKTQVTALEAAFTLDLSERRARRILKFLASDQAEATKDFSGIDKKITKDGRQVFYRLELKLPDMKNVSVVIMAGGDELGFFPAYTDRTQRVYRAFSRDNKPLLLKQIETAQRLGIDLKDIFIPCRAENLDQLLKILPDSFPRANILLEPKGRQSAAVVGLTLQHLKKRYGENRTAIFLQAKNLAEGTPEQIQKSFKQAVQGAQNSQSIVTLAAPAKTPSPYFGYLKLGVPAKTGEGNFGVDQLTEKPDRDKAAKLVKQPGELYNTGIMVMGVGTGIEAYKRTSPLIARWLEEAGEKIGTSGEDQFLSQTLPDKVAVALGRDFTNEILLHSETRLAAVPAEFAWLPNPAWGDLSTGINMWGNLKSGSGDVSLSNTESNIIYVGKGKKVSLDNTSDLFVAVEDNTLVVVHKSLLPGLRSIIEEMRRHAGNEPFVAGDLAAQEALPAQNEEQQLASNVFSGYAYVHPGTKNCRIGEHKGLVVLAGVEGLEVIQEANGAWRLKQSISPKPDAARGRQQKALKRAWAYVEVVASITGVFMAAIGIFAIVQAGALTLAAVGFIFFAVLVILLPFLLDRWTTPRAPLITTGQAANFEGLKQVVEHSLGPKEALAITNGGDDIIVRQQFLDQRKEIFRKDGRTKVMAVEEAVRRGQFLGLLDAIRLWIERFGPLDKEKVSVGIMMPGKGTRMSPFTQRAHGIKPFLPMLIRTHKKGQWLSGAEASLYTWTLAAHHLHRMGFRGMAWKWGDEPQFAARRMADMDMDLRGTDAVRFGAETIITEDLAQNKEWLYIDPQTGEFKQVRRRSRQALLERLGLEDTPQAKAYIHLGSPAFSYDFLEAAEKIFHDLDKGWIDVDGYVFEAMTQDHETWMAEAAKDKGLQELLLNFPDFYARVQALKYLLNLQKEVRRNPELGQNRFIAEFLTATDWQEISSHPLFITTYLRQALGITGIKRYTDYAEFERDVRQNPDMVPLGWDKDRLLANWQKVFRHPDFNGLIAIQPSREQRRHADLYSEFDLKHIQNGLMMEATSALDAALEALNLNHPLNIKVMDYGEGLYWGDIGQLAKARETMWMVNDRETEAGAFARQLAAIDHVKPDKFGNMVVGDSVVPQDGSVRNSVVIDTKIYGRVQIDGAVIVNSQLGNAHIEKGSVVYGATVHNLIMEQNGYSYLSVGENVRVPKDFVHTSMPRFPQDPSQGLEDWLADSRVNVGSGDFYNKPQWGNSASLAEKLKQMRQEENGKSNRVVQPDEIEKAIDFLYRRKLLARMKSRDFTLRPVAYEQTMPGVSADKQRRIMEYFGLKGIRAIEFLRNGRVQTVDANMRKVVQFPDERLMYLKTLLLNVADQSGYIRKISFNDNIIRFSYWNTKREPEEVEYAFTPGEEKMKITVRVKDVRRVRVLQDKARSIIPKDAAESATLAEVLAFRPEEESIAFGTSGMRGLLGRWRDLQVYAKTRGFIRYAKQQGVASAGDRFALAEDLRPGHWITRAIAKAAADEGLVVVNCGKISTSDLSLFGFQNKILSAMKTGSHIPFERDGIKFNWTDREVMKSEEKGILAAVDQVMQELLAQPAAESLFDEYGMFKFEHQPVLPESTSEAVDMADGRMARMLPPGSLGGMRVALYQHSAVGRDHIPRRLEKAGAQVYSTGRTEVFTAVDTEKLDRDILFRILGIAEKAEKEMGGLDAVVFTDGDSDRPGVCPVEKKSALERIVHVLAVPFVFVWVLATQRSRQKALMEAGFLLSPLKVAFYSGELTGALVTEYLHEKYGVTSAAFTISSSEAVIEHLTARGLQVKQTRIGSPEVIAAGKDVSFEANGGFLLQKPLATSEGTVEANPTRSADFPIAMILAMAKEKKMSVARLYRQLPKWYGKSDFIDNFPEKKSRKLKAYFNTDHPDAAWLTFAGDRIIVGNEDRQEIGSLEPDSYAAQVLRARKSEFEAAYQSMWSPLGLRLRSLLRLRQPYLITRICMQDGVRIYFADGNVAHIRPSSNAPQLRIYSCARSQGRADKIAVRCIAEPNGVFRRLERMIDAKKEPDLQPVSLAGMQPAVQTAPKAQESSIAGFIKGFVLSLAGAVAVAAIEIFTHGHEGLLQAGVWGLLVFAAYAAVKIVAIEAAKKNNARAMA
ncbi:hypothetical protein JW933_02160, partial [candidate division FCPU426 bacterium]|nr:hypothetical protein [candidate division FCPU426 bacterium]